MHATQKIINTKIGHQKTAKGQYRVNPVVAGRTEPGKALSVERQAVDNQRYECPTLLWIPTPICSPRNIRPNSSQKDSCGKQENSGFQQTAFHKTEYQQSITHHDHTNVNAEPRAMENWHQLSYLGIHLAQMGHQKHKACT